MSESRESNHQITGALMLPSGSNNVEILPNQPRQPQSLQGLLKFCMEATKLEDAPSESQIGPMDEERKKFLEDALKNITTNVAKEIQDSIKTLSDFDRLKSIGVNDTLPDDLQYAFDNILQFVDDIDVANDFHKIGGFSILPKCLSCESEQLKASACELIAELCQNNPYCQARVLDCGLLNVLISMVQSERSKLVLSKAMYALSCATREYEASCNELLFQNGCAVLINTLHSDHLPVRTKATFLILHLVKHYKQARDKFIELEIVRHVIDLLNDEHNETTEHILALLHSLVSEDSKAISQCLNTKLNELLESILADKSDTYTNEVKEYSQDILNIIQKYPQQTCVDR